MLKYSPLIDLFFEKLPFPARIAEIAECGFKYFETWQTSDAGLLKSMSDAGRNCGVELISVLLNKPDNEEVAPVNRSRHSAFIEQIDRLSDNALAAGCRQGIVTTGSTVYGSSLEEQENALIEVMRAAGEKSAAKGFRLVLEPLNTLVGYKNYFLDSRDAGVEIVKKVGLDNVKLLYDIYHMGIMYGNQTEFILANIDVIGHFHSAGIPGRHELFSGEINYPFLVKKIEESGYNKFFGLEYIPELEGIESLLKTLDYLRVK